MVGTEFKRYCQSIAHLNCVLFFFYLLKICSETVCLFHVRIGLLSKISNNKNIFVRYLQQAEQLYTDYVDQVSDQPVDVYDLFTTPDSCQPQTKAESPLEKVHTLTLYYLAQVYGTLGNPIKSAIYCHTTLKRQLESNVSFIIF